MWNLPVGWHHNGHGEGRWVVEDGSVMALDELNESLELLEWGDLFLKGSVNGVDVVHAGWDELVDDAVVSLVASEGDLSAVGRSHSLLQDGNEVLNVIIRVLIHLSSFI